MPSPITDPTPPDRNDAEGDRSAAATEEEGAGPAVHRPRNDVDAARAFAIEAARLLKDDRCDDITVLDVSGVSQITDFIVIASGTPDRQMRSGADDVKKLA